ncbi:MerR family transcriptional regulator [Bacillus sp. J14TS2]|uniref:MerR family transcriptional regulator n=1 Tax=Bacillus sp. J14TS2 TaxID=2807188 RepID=UPI001BB3F450|nr:MerR family transcriptional regulator [Bacillus sp. J14TS2]
MQDKKVQGGDLLHYTIKEFSKITGLTPYTLRFYEKIGLLKVKRDNNQNRIYDDLNKDWVDFFLHLKRTGMSLEDLKQYMAWWNQGDETILERLEMLKKQKQTALTELEKLQEGITELDRKITQYNKALEKHKRS